MTSANSPHKIAKFQSVKEWDEHLNQILLELHGKVEEPTKEAKTGKELDTRLMNFKSLLAHLNSSNEEEVLRG